MSVTISELESERSKILEEIENRAQEFSSDDKSTSPGPSLQSWLSAAEDVMPEQAEEKNMRKPDIKSKYTGQAMKPSPKNKASFFGVIIMLSLLLTLIGVLYIAYTSIHKELQSVLETNQQTMDKMVQLQSNMEALQKSIATGGKSELFVALEDKVYTLEAQVKTLQDHVEQAVVTDGALPVASVASSKSEVAKGASQTSADAVTAEELDAKLSSYASQIEANIGKKLDNILSMLAGKEIPLETSSAKTYTPKIAEPSVVEPSITETTSPVINTPVMETVKTASIPTVPTVPDADLKPIKNFTADVKWLMSEPEMHHTLQLASMSDKASLQDVIKKKNLTDVRIIEQIRKGVINYVLITGSFENRVDADKLAKKIKSEYNISPWIRKVKDLTSKIQ